MERALEVARASGLIEPRAPLLVLLSGGADSVCLLDVAVRLEAEVSALHLNYGLRDGADADEAHCRALCESLGVELTVERVELGDSGNLQARARDLRYRHAERLATGDYAAAHTASDQAETVLYRLAVSPGRRALFGMEPRRERLVRPLLSATREDTHEYCRERGLQWREDPSNEDRRFSRARVRHDVLPALKELNPAAERGIAETARVLRDEAEVLDRLAGERLDDLGGGPAISLAHLVREPPALARLVLRGLAEAAAGEQRSLSRDEVDAVMALGDRGGTQSVDLGGGLRAVSEYGTLRFTRDRDATPPEPVDLHVPGSVRFGEWEVEAALGVAGEATVSAERAGSLLHVRAWRDGDTMRPVGLGGTKSLQDLFTDRKVPRALRRSLPVVESAGDIVWVAGVALDARYALHEGEEQLGLSARRR